ncbi:hypothetical protein TTHERM_00621580 (macronuclear) [Tetrahymena thermophila SB210]|uniref:Uncharacterized protein n=1 Tax=Tetrahymena thermophila (strain SB210) TaxID=312017 RepID=Q23MA1_TETTS|nr:hypothetical protein TTHERM_00621580 [Tetrahymena thermophila SB210]EAR97738.2 hypothetical protein TTHERM_00621580 [Tetrahymena thermophila SB210]|eukprot:XP_001017983.2 hypothetical protein TTHERM_00621580 [Tetrahymena thermophila SB210]
MNSPLAQQYSSGAKENAQYLNGNSQKGNLGHLSSYSSNNSSHVQSANSSNRFSSLAGLKSIVNPSPTVQNPQLRKGSMASSNQEQRATNMNFSQGHIGNSQQQSLPSSQLGNHQRSFSNSKLLQQKYVSQSSKNNSIQNQTNSNGNISNSENIYVSNHSSANANYPNAHISNQQSALPNNQSVNNQCSSVNSNQNSHFQSANLHNFSNNESGAAQQQQSLLGPKNNSPPKQNFSSSTQSATNAAFNLFKNNYLKQSSTTVNLSLNQATNSTNQVSTVNPTSNNQNNTASKISQPIGNNQQSSTTQQYQHSNNTGKGQINMKQRLTYSNQSSTPKQVTPPSSNQGQLAQYQSIDKQSHLQSIEKIKEDINKKLILQQQLNAQIGVSNQNSNGSKSSTPQGLSNKMSSSNSEHKNNSTAATNNILLSINNQSTSVSRKASSGTMQTNKNNINSIVNNHSNNLNSLMCNSNSNNSNQILINSCSKSQNMSSNNQTNNVTPISSNTVLSNANNINRIINETTSLNATTNNLAQNSHTNLNNNSFTNIKGEDNSSTNIIFEKVKKRKMNNFSIGNQNSPNQISTSQPQSHLSSQKNLQYIIQNKTPNIQTPSCGSSQKGLSKTMSFSGHSNNFYSTNCYIKSPQINNNNNQGNYSQNHSIAATNSLNQTGKIKNKKFNSNYDIPSQQLDNISSNKSHINQGISNIIHNQTNLSSTPFSVAHSSNPQLQKNNFSLEGPGSTSGNMTNHARNNSSNNLSPKLNKENLFMESQFNSLQGNIHGIGNLNTMNGNQLLLKDPKMFFKNSNQLQNINSSKAFFQQTSSQNTTPTHSNQVTYPTLNGQSSYNQKYSDSNVHRQNNNQNLNPLPLQSIQTFPQQNQSLNSSFIQNNAHIIQNQPQVVGSLNSSFWSQQTVNNKIILNKLDNFDLENTSNPIDHISEITSLLLISLQDTPLAEAIKKFEENVLKINTENKQKQRQIQHKLNQKLKEIEILQQDLNLVQNKLSQKENELSKGTSTVGLNKKKIDQQTQTSSKKKQQNNKNSVIQICDQDGNVQEVDTDKENEMLKDYILEQEKKVNQFKEKESKMIKLLLAVKKRGIDIDDIYNNDVLNEESNDEILKNNPPQIFPVKKKRNQVDTEFFKKLDNDFQYADNSIVNDSDESSFGFFGKPSDREISQSITIKPQKSKLKQQTKAPPKIPQKLQEKFKQNLQNIQKQESDDDEEDDENNKLHQNILKTLNINQQQLDQLQEQIQKDPNNLTPEQINLIQQIHQIQQMHEKQQKEAVQNKNQNQNQAYQQNFQQQVQTINTDQQILNFDQESSCTDSQLDVMQSNILPSDLKKQLTTISRQSEDDIQVIDEQQLNVEEEFAKYFVQK